MVDNPSFVLKGIEDVVFEQRPIPEIGPEEVLIKVQKTGICGSDVHYLVHGSIGQFVLKSPMVLGHESSGIVSEVGANVKTHKVGDRVALEPGKSCGTCDICKAGKYQLCPDMIFAATPPYDGSLCRFYSLPAHLAYHLPAHVSLEDGALIEPLAVGIHSVANLGALKANQSVVVFGCGPVGLLCMAVAKALGASRIIAVDIVPGRLEFAKAYAATDVFQPPPLEASDGKIETSALKLKYSERSAIAMKAALGIEERGPKSINLIIDASGAEVSIQTAFHIAGVGSTYVQVGMGNPEISFNLGLMMTKELVYKGSFRYGPGDYTLAIALVGQGKIDLKPLVTHRYKFEDAIVAFDANRKGRSEDGKPVIKILISGPDVSTDMA